MFLSFLVTRSSTPGSFQVSTSLVRIVSRSPNSGGLLVSHLSRSFTQLATRRKCIDGLYNLYCFHSNTNQELLFLGVESATSRAHGAFDVLSMDTRVRCLIFECTAYVCLGAPDVVASETTDDTLCHHSVLWLRLLISPRVSCHWR